MVFNATFYNISVISWCSVLLVGETTDMSQVTDAQECMGLVTWCLTRVKIRCHYQSFPSKTLSKKTWTRCLLSLSKLFDHLCQRIGGKSSFNCNFYFAPLWRIGPRCSSAETQVCHRSYIIAARLSQAKQLYIFFNLYPSYTAQGTNFLCTCTKMAIKT
jgi:hypothetical protein